MLIWATKTNVEDSYITQKSPSSYGGEVEDLDKNSYRSVANGNLMDTVISKAWSKLSFNYSCLSCDEIGSLMSLLKNNPIYVRAKDPALGTEYVEMQMRCSKKSWELLQTGDYKLSFNLVQKKKVEGQ